MEELFEEWWRGRGANAAKQHVATPCAIQPPCAQELLAGGDDGLADGFAGPDGAYDEWRRLYGTEWARWYGLQVRAVQRRAPSSRSLGPSPRVGTLPGVMNGSAPPLLYARGGRLVQKMYRHSSAQ